MENKKNINDLKRDLKIGFIGQGWIGKNYADEFERRGFNIVRYSLDEEHKHNGDAIAECDVVFIAVPTPSTIEGFDDCRFGVLVAQKAGLTKEHNLSSFALPEFELFVSQQHQKRK